MDLTYFTAVKYLIEKDVFFDDKTIDDTTIPSHNNEVLDVVDYLVKNHGYTNKRVDEEIRFSDEWLLEMENSFLSQTFSTAKEGDFAKFGNYILKEHFRRHIFTKPDVLLTTEERTEELKKHIAYIAQEYYKKTHFSISQINISGANDYYTNVTLTLNK